MFSEDYKRAFAMANEDIAFLVEDVGKERAIQILGGVFNAVNRYLIQQAPMEPMRWPQPLDAA